MYRTVKSDTQNLLDLEGKEKIDIRDVDSGVAKTKRYSIMDDAGQLARICSSRDVMWSDRMSYGHEYRIFNKYSSKTHPNLKTSWSVLLEKCFDYYCT